MTNRSHNTLVIGDKLQNTAAVAKVVDFGVTPLEALRSGNGVQRQRDGRKAHGIGRTVREDKHEYPGDMPLSRSREGPRASTNARKGA